MFAAIRLGRSVCFALLLFLPVASDTVLLKNGNTIEGEVTEKGDVYEILTSDGTKTVKKSDVGGLVKSSKNKPKETSPKAENPASSTASTDARKPTALERTLEEAQKAFERKRYTEARTMATRIVKQAPDSLEAVEAKALLDQIPHPDGRLICGFDSANEVDKWRIEKFMNYTVVFTLTTEKPEVFEGTGAVRLGLTRDPDYTTGAVIMELGNFDEKKFRGLSFWVFQHQPSPGRLEAAFIRPNQERLVWVDKHFGGSEMGACIYFATPLNFTGWKQFKIPATSFQSRGAEGVSNKITWPNVGALVFYDASRKGIDCVIDSVRFIESE